MNREETLTLYEQGVEAWNKWANEMLEERKKLEEAGECNENADEFNNKFGENLITREWKMRAKAIFSDKKTPNTFKNKANFSHFNFPEDVIFEKLKFLSDVTFEEAVFHQTVNFKNCTFEKKTSFALCKFNNDVYFDFSVFNDETSFSNAHFYGLASFPGSTFKKEIIFTYSDFNLYTTFSNVRFYDAVYFDNTNFNWNVNFNNCHFYNYTNYSNSHFKKSAEFNSSFFNHLVSFNSAKFKGFSSFNNTYFETTADFSGITSETIFDLQKTYFYLETPDFIQANFKEAPRLDNVDIGISALPGHFINSIFVYIPRDIKARYQALKRLAVQAHDHENEQRFWAGELRSDRSLRTENAGWNLRPLISAFWWGNIAYEFLSNFGRSIVRPLAYLIALALIMTGIHIYTHHTLNKEPTSNLRTKTHITKQSDLKDCNIKSSAFRVAAKNGAIGLLQNPAKRSTFVRDYTCLYGTYNDNVTPKVPNYIFWIELFHTLFSAILIFLTLLGIRNNFKLK